MTAERIQIRHQLFIRTNLIKPDRQSVWLLHGFADSGLAYREIFESPISKDLNIYVVDLPGFGSSPIQPDYLSMKEQAGLLARIIEEETADQKQINILAHSLGALIGTWLCEQLTSKINYYFNIEGNLTEADSYFSSKPLQFKTAEDFVTSFYEEVFEKAKLEERYKRYYSSLRFADPEGMRNWSVTSQEFIQGNQCGFAFNRLPCEKIYIWGDVDTPKETQAFIQEQGIPNKLYEGIGHWHMLENAATFYKDIHEMIGLD